MKTQWTPAELESAKRKLTALRASLDEQVSKIEENVLSPSGDPQGQRADESGDDAAFEREAPALDAANATMEQVHDALQRIAEGTYGRCERCAGGIERARLALVPYASACAACARLIETEAAR